MTMTDAQGLPVPPIPMGARLMLASLFGIGLVVPPWVVSQLETALQAQSQLALFAATAVGLVQATLLCRAVARRMRAKLLPTLTTHAWYVKTFPQNVHNGQLSCRHCGSHKKTVRSLPDNLQLRNYSCGTCGGFLFVSSN